MAASIVKSYIYDEGQDYMYLITAALLPPSNTHVILPLFPQSIQHSLRNEVWFAYQQVQ